MESKQGSQLLADTLNGDLAAFVALSRRDQGKGTLQEYAAQLGEEDLVLRPRAVRRVLVALEEGEVRPALVQEWASFMRRGYISRVNTSPIASYLPAQPIEALAIEYDSSAEEQIADVVSRLDEIGDLLDGEVTRSEIEKMLDELP